MLTHTLTHRNLMKKKECIVGHTPHVSTRDLAWNIALNNSRCNNRGVRRAGRTGRGGRESQHKSMFAASLRRSATRWAGVRTTTQRKSMFPAPFRRSTALFIGLLPVSVPVTVLVAVLITALVPTPTQAQAPAQAEAPAPTPAQEEAEARVPPKTAMLCYEMEWETPVDGAAYPNIVVTPDGRHLVCTTRYHTHPQDYYKDKHEQRQTGDIFVITNDGHLLWRDKRLLNNAIAASPNSEFVAVGGKNNDVLLFRIRGLELVKTFQAHTDQVSSIAFTPDGKYLITAGHNAGGIHVWDVACDAQRCMKPVHTFELYDPWAMCVTPNGAMLVVTTGGGELIMFDLVAKKRAYKYFVSGEHRPMDHVAVSRCGRMVFTGSRSDGRMGNKGDGARLWHFDGPISPTNAASARMNMLKTSSGDIRNPAFSDRWVVFTDHHNSPSLFAHDLVTGERALNFEPFEEQGDSVDGVSSLAVTPGGRVLYVASRFRAVRKYTLHPNDDTDENDPAAWWAAFEAKQQEYTHVPVSARPSFFDKPDAVVFAMVPRESDEAKAAAAAAAAAGRACA